MQNTKRIKKAARIILTTVLVVLILDFLILIGGLLQVALEGQSGEWSPFWRVQAELLLRLLGHG